MCCTLLFYPTQQDPTHLTKVALGNLDAAIAQLGKRQTKDMKVPGSTPGLIICPLSACEVRRERGHSVLFRQRRPTNITRPGLEPGPSSSGGQRLIHQANGPSVDLFQAEAMAKIKASKSSWCRITDLRPTADQLAPTCRCRFKKPECYVCVDSVGSRAWR